MINSRFSRSLFFLLLTQISLISATARVTIIFVVDQFPYHLLQELRPYLRYGIKTLLDNGAVFENAYYPHAMPGTGTGHTGLATGCYADTHGIINNKWYTSDGSLVLCDEDSPERAAVFEKNGIPSQKQGKSSRNIMVQGLSDQFMVQAKPGITKHAVSISFKSRAAIATAGSAGKAIWFNDKGGFFTSSTAYFDSMPDWLIEFNRDNKIDVPHSITWKPLYRPNSIEYARAYSENYTFTAFQKTILNTKIQVPDAENPQDPYMMMTITPHANQLLLDLALECLKEFDARDRNTHVLLWVCLSPFDYMCHRFGPHSKEAYDMIYHLDYQLKKFMNKVTSFVKASETLYVFTSDHGVAPIPEMARKSGIASAQRVDEHKLIDELNAVAYKEYGLSKFIVAFKTPQFYCNENLIASWDKKKQKELMHSLVAHLKKNPAIANAWTTQELMKGGSCENIRGTFKHQIYPGRSGHIIVQLKPFCQISDYKYGTDHMTPYEHDTHVPLIIYQYGLLEELHIAKRVSMLQVANSLAQAMDIPKPSASLEELLPALFPTTKFPCVS